MATADALIVPADGNASAPTVARCFRNATSQTATAATFSFTADAGTAAYYLYYPPFTTCEYANGACQYSADVTYHPVTHCLDAPWWPPGEALLHPTAVAYEAATAFDAFTDMERPMSPGELAAFVARAAPAGSGGALLIAESAGSSARVWGGGGSGGPAPFCVYAAAAGGYYLKTGGDPAVRSGWDQGHADKCCSTGASDCVWFPSASACAAFDPARCRACSAGGADMGCPAWGAGSGVLLPYKYAAVSTAALAQLSATLTRNQNFSFQALVVGPADSPLQVTSVAFDAAGADPQALAFSSYSTQAVDFWGRASALMPTVYGTLPLWLGASVARGAAAGAYNATVTVTLTSAASPNATRGSGGGAH